MVETTKTAEALETAVGGQGVMQSEYFKLKYNPETGRWEKEKVTEDITPVFPGIRDVTPDYTSEGKTFRTIPIGGAPDYAAVDMPVPPEEITHPVEPSPEPEPIVQPIVTQPEQVDRGTDVAQEQIEREQVFKPKNTFVDTDGVTKKAIVAQPSYRTKYESMPGGLNNMSDAQALQYAVETCVLNQILSKDNNPYFVAEPEKKDGIMAELGGAATVGLKLGATILDSTLGKSSRKALVNRLIEGGILEGNLTDFIDDKGNFKLNNEAKLQRVFQDNDTPMNGLVSTEVPLPLIDIEFDNQTKKINLEKIVPVDKDLQKRYQEKGTYFNSFIGEEITLDENKGMQKRLKDELNENNKILAKEVPPYKSSMFPGPVSKNNIRNIILGQQRVATEQNKKIITALTSLVNQQAAITMGQAGITSLGVSPPPIIPKEKPLAPLVPSYFETAKMAKIKRTTVNGINYQFVDAGISEAQPVVGLSGDHTNGEKVYLDSNAGFYNSQGQYVADDNGDGQVDKVRGGSASEAAEAANAGFIPQKLLDRMTNPDGSLKNLYAPGEKDFTGGQYKLDSSVVEIRDGKAYYVGNVVKENRDVVDKDNKVVDNAAPSGSNDKQTYEIKKKAEKTKESGGPAGMGSAPSGGGDSGGGSADKKSKSIVCTEMYRQTQLDDWQRTIKLWYLFQKKYLSKTHQKGYHFLFKPFVKGMQKSNILTSIGRHFAQERTKDIKHIMYGTKFSLLGRVYRIILEPICFVVGLLLWQKK